MDKTAILEELARSVLEMDADLAVKATGRVIGSGFDPYSAIDVRRHRGPEAAPAEGGRGA